MHLVTGEFKKMRKTGWFSICCRRRDLREAAPSKKLLLYGVIRNDKLAHNGEVFIKFIGLWMMTIDVGPSIDA